MTTASAPYAAFGETLLRLRVTAGFAKQQELATALGKTQQSVSRWEKGLARPRSNEIPSLEILLGAKKDELLELAGYKNGRPTTGEYETATTHDRSLPLGALVPETFESFCTALLDRMYRSKGASAHRYGATGHKQDGIDILVSGPFGAHSFQCKRVTEFGAQKVHTAVANQTFKADFKVLLLSSVASPKARDAIAVHDGWELWDREDITRKFHEIAMCDRLDLVDRYFSGQRLDLLGVDEAGPIQNAEDFFKPFMVSERFFNHSWPLIGRQNEVTQLMDAVQDESVLLTCLIGSPGAGKSRLLLEISQRLSKESNLHVRFVSPTEDVKAYHLDKLRDSNKGETLLIVDDAHERDDLGALLRHAAVPESRTRLLLSLRPYGKKTLKMQAATVSLTGPMVRFVEMHQQTPERAEELAKLVLTECGGPVKTASAIAKATFTTPLATVLAAQLMARDKVSLELLGNATEFRTYVLSRLQDVIALTLVTGQDTAKLKAVLRVVALLQPIIPDDPNLLRILLEVEKVEQSDATRLMRLLVDAGVMFKRGVRYRLAPDLLADEIIRENCLTEEGSANILVLEIFERSNTQNLKNLFINLGRLDWRLREGNTDDSPLLNSLAPKLRWGEKYHNPHLEAVEAIAYYQPRFALDFAKRLIEEKHGDSSSVCNMVRNAAYTYSHVGEACQLLWFAGRSDTRALHQYPSHGIRILNELASFQVNKPVQYAREVVRFALALLKRPASLNYHYTPFSILEGALGTETETTSVSRLTVTFTRYQLPLDQFQAVRREAVDALLDYLRDGPPQRAFLAAQTMAQALRAPIHGDSTDNAWQREHQELLQGIRSVLSDVQIPPVILVRLAQSVSWHAFHGWPSTSSEAKEILSLLDRDLRTRVIRALVDGWGSETWKLNISKGRKEHESYRAQLTTDLIAAFPDLTGLLKELNICLQETSDVSRGRYGTPLLLVNHLLGAVPGLASELVKKSLEDKAANLSPYVGNALTVILDTEDSELIDAYVSQSTDSAKPLAQVTEAYARFAPSRQYTQSEVALFGRIFTSKDPTVLFFASSLMHQLALKNPSLAVEMVCLVDFTVNARATHDMLMWVAGGDLITDGDLASRRSELLEKLVTLKELDDYWVREFLIASMRIAPAAVVDLVKNRLLGAMRRKDWSYKPLQPDSHGNGLGLTEAEAGPRLISEFLDWALQHLDDVHSVRRFGEAIAGLCGKYDDLMLDSILSWMSAGSVAHARVVAGALREAQPTLIYDYPAFVRNVIDSAELISDDALAEVRYSILSATLSDGKEGTPGEPFPQDVRLEEHCLQMLAGLSRAEPVFQLYEDLLRSARDSIARQQRFVATLDEED